MYAIQRIVLGLFFSILLLPTSINAEPSDETVRKAKSLFEQAQSLYAQGKYERALIRYEAAYELYESPTIAFNIGQCHRLLGHSRDAIKYYEIFLEKSPDTPYRQEIEENIALLKLQVEKEELANDKEEIETQKEIILTQSEELKAQFADLEEKLSQGVEVDPFARERFISTQVYLGVAISTGAAAGLLGAFSIKNALDAKALINGGQRAESQANINRAKGFGLAADALLIATAFFTLRTLQLKKKKNTKERISLSVSPSQITFSLRY